MCEGGALKLVHTFCNHLTSDIDPLLLNFLNFLDLWLQAERLQWEAG